MRYSLCALVTVSCCGLSCGAKTGLRDLHFDASVSDVAPVDPVCRPLRVRTRPGTAVPLELIVDEAPRRSEGFMWSLRRSPDGSRSDLLARGDATARLTPDRAGIYDISVTTPFVLATGSPLRCEVTVLAEPETEDCPAYALVEPTVVPLPGAPRQIALEHAWGRARINAGGPAGTGIVAVDAARDDVAGLVIEQAVTNTDLARVAMELEARAARAVGATAVLVGTEANTHDGLRLRRSLFRVASLSTTAAVLRDRIAREVTGLNPGYHDDGFTGHRAFVYELTTVLHPGEARATVLLAAAPEVRFDDHASATSFRLRDMTNASGLARVNTRYEVTCQRFTATRTVQADFLWLVDTSRSMEDDQERLGNTAARFFSEMSAAGVELRVGVMQAGSAVRGPDLDDPGFEWISGSDPMGPQQLAWQVTYRPFRDMKGDTVGPYPLEGQEEEPVAAGVVTVEAMERRAASDPEARRSFRRDATRAVFFVTDEDGTNEERRFFARDPMRWGATPEARVRAATQWFRQRDMLTFGMANLFRQGPCPAVENLVPCVVTGNGGAYIPLDTALDAEVASGLSRIVDIVAGAASEFVLTRPPLSSTLRVAVETRLVPRSRADGFDWNQDALALTFRGNTYRPRRGQVVRTAYFRWSTP